MVRAERKMLGILMSAKPRIVPAKFVASKVVF